MHIVHIDESAALGAAAGRAAQGWNGLETKLRESDDISVHVVPLQAVCSGTEEEKIKCLETTLSLARDATSREDLRRSLRMRLLHTVAQSLNCNKILLGESCSKLASQFLAAASKVLLPVSQTVATGTAPFRCLHNFSTQ